MEMVNLMLHRRSVRRYTDEVIPEDALQKVLYAGLSAASSKNRRPWEFVVIRHRKTLDALCDCRPGAGNLLGKCNAAIVVCADAEAVDVWVEDCASAMTQMHLMADMLGLGSCWLQIRNRQSAEGLSTEEIVRETLGIPAKYGVMAILTLGMPAEHPAPHTIEELLTDKIHRERF